jgi:microcystin-dependent protein
MEPFIGQIQLFVFGYAPAGWRLCDGSLLPIKDNEALFSLIRNRYGGDGISNFAVPNSMGARPLNVSNNLMSYYIATWGNYPIRS